MTQGESLQEVTANMREAVEGWLAARNELQPESPDDQLVEIEV
ncbi:MAG: hypothetical protein QM775_31470 [Pirellulales bacterium]